MDQNCASKENTFRGRAGVRQKELVAFATHLTQIQWNMANYRTKQSLKNLTEIFANQVGQIKTYPKAKAEAYNNLKSSLQSMENKQLGGLVTRALGDLVKKEHFVLEYKLLTTLLVVVSLGNIQD